MSGIVKTYAGPADVRVYSGPGLQTFANRYRSGQRKPASEMTVAEAKAELARRAQCYQREHQGTEYVAACREILSDDPVLQARCRLVPGAGTRQAPEYLRRRNHQVEVSRLRTYKHHGDVPAALADAGGDVAGLPPAFAADARARQEQAQYQARLFGLAPAPTVRTHAAGPMPERPAHLNMARIAPEVVPWIVAAGWWTRAEVAQWHMTVSPPPRPISGLRPGTVNSGRADVQTWNRLHQQTVDGMLEAGRDILNDPRQKAQIAAVLRERRL